MMRGRWILIVVEVKLAVCVGCAMLRDSVEEEG